MRYIDWYDYIKNPFKTDTAYQMQLPEHCIAWKDIVTGTIFYLDRKKAEEISIKAADYIQSTLMPDINAVFEYISGRKKPQDKDFDISIFPQLPVSKDNKGEKAHRISDHFIIRTGMLYALKHSEAGKDAVRRHGLLKGLNYHGGKEIAVENAPELDGLVEMLDRFMLGENSDEFKRYSFDVVKGATLKVKQYYLETNKIKEIRGASIILDSINRERIVNYIKESFLEECIIYCGGGNILGIFPEGQGGNVCREIEKIHEQVSITAQSAAEYQKMTLFDLSREEYGQSISDLQLKLTERQMLKVNWQLNPETGNLNYWLPGKKDYGYDGFEKADRANVCSRCSMRTARYKYFTGDEKEELCLSCLHKLLEGGEGKKGFINDYISYCKAELGKEIEYSKNTGSLEDIAKAEKRGSYIGVIYGDGNNMGKVVQEVEGLAQMRFFSETTARAVFDAAYRSMANNLEGTPFEIIAIGGDDIFMIVPGDKALPVSVELGRIFDGVFKNRSVDKCAITMSLGVCISHYSAPVQYLFDLAQQLLKSAKKKARREDAGTIDIMVLETESAVGAVLKDLREEMEGRQVIHTLRPYTWNEAEAVMEVIRTLEKGDFKSAAYSFDEASYRLGKGEAELFYLYQLSRLKQEKKAYIENAVTQFCRALCRESGSSIRHNAMNILEEDRRGQKTYSPWTDIVELWDYIPEERQVKGNG